jgi:hypothetical protein
MMALPPKSTASNFTMTLQGKDQTSGIDQLALTHRMDHVH